MSKRTPIGNKFIRVQVYLEVGECHRSKNDSHQPKSMEKF